MGWVFVAPALRLDLVLFGWKDGVGGSSWWAASRSEWSILESADVD